MIYMYLKKVNMFHLQVQVLLCKAVTKFSNFCVYENFFTNAQQVDGKLNGLQRRISFGSIFLLLFSFNEISQGAPLPPGRLTALVESAYCNVLMIKLRFDYMHRLEKTHLKCFLPALSLLRCC